MFLISYKSLIHLDFFLFLKIFFWGMLYIFLFYGCNIITSVSLIHLFFKNHLNSITFHFCLSLFLFIFLSLMPVDILLAVDIKNRYLLQT